MAKRSKIVANERRREVVERYAARRSELKDLIRRPGTSDEQRQHAQLELQRQPRDASATRVRNRDAVDGRPRGHLRAFGLSRMRFRQYAHQGYLPGVINPAGSPHPRGETVKVRASLRSLKNKPGSQIVRRHGKIFVINKQNPKWKARQG